MQIVLIIWMVVWVGLWSSLPFASFDFGAVDSRFAWLYYALLLIACLVVTKRSALLRKPMNLDKGVLRLAVARAGTFVVWAAFIWLVILR